ncbi:alginate export family protein [Sphingomonas morindae]|uniref:Alginate export family protein n=1 Tax=Sphingomonas morindae TaxID=1541170 RepID=A0ABY4XCN7_9SPHN|nr:alginate export family protein [Sphingomonas morindae]USI74731.1 alginate export family protein [Sphingomonas morindae]
MVTQKAKRLGRGAAGLLALLGAVPAPALAATPWTLHDALDLPAALTVKLGIRARLEGLEGQFRPTGPESDHFVSFRTDLLVDYDDGRIVAGGELRDARGYGEKHDSTVGVSDINALEPLQAYLGLGLKGVGGQGAGGRAIAGRYTLETGAGRLIGRPDFSNSINSYTGVLLDWHSAAKDRLVLFANEPSSRLPNDSTGIHDNRITVDAAHRSLRFFGGDVTKAALLPHLLGEAYYYRLAERDRPDLPTRNRHLATYGARLQLAPRAGHPDFEFEFANQVGRARATTAITDRTDLPVRARLVHGELGWRLPIRTVARLSLHGDLATGDDRDPHRYTRFDTLFGASRADFGPTGLYGAVTRSNLRSVGLRAETTPTPRLDMFAMTRLLWLDQPTDAFAATAVRDRTGRSGRFAGTQVEGRVRYWLIAKQLKVDVGGAVLAKGRFLRDAPNARADGDSHYGFIDLALDI